MKTTKETECVMCGEPVVAVEDDYTPTCDRCQAVWAETQVSMAISNGDLVLAENVVEEDDDEQR